MKHGRLRVSCSCKSSFQDEKYGTKIRVATPMNNSRRENKLTAVSCTVCGAKHDKFKET